MNAEDEKLVMQAMRDSSQLVAAMPPAVPSYAEAVAIARKINVSGVISREGLAEFGIRFMREALAATQEQRDASYWEKAWARQIADVVGSQKAVEIVNLAMLNGLFDPFRTHTSSERDAL